MRERPRAIFKSPIPHLVCDEEEDEEDEIDHLEEAGISCHDDQEEGASHKEDPVGCDQLPQALVQLCSLVQALRALNGVRGVSVCSVNAAATWRQRNNKQTINRQTKQKKQKLETNNKQAETANKQQKQQTNSRNSKQTQKQQEKARKGKLVKKASSKHPCPPGSELRGSKVRECSCFCAVDVPWGMSWISPEEVLLARYFLQPITISLTSSRKALKKMMVHIV